MTRVITLSIAAAIAVSGAGSVTAQDAPKGWLIVPSIKLWRPLYEIPIVNREYDMGGVGNGVGWLTQTNWVTDDWGTVALAGHSDGAFEQLDELRIGDSIYLYTMDYEEVYAVTAINHGVEVSDWQWLAPALEGEHLILVTCEGNARLIVEAVRIK